MARRTFNFSSTLAAVHLAMVYLTSFIFLELLILTSTDAAPEEGYVTLARCRVQCLKKFVSESRQADDNACWDTNNYRKEYNKECYDCWDLCKTFASSPTLLTQACGNNKLCGDGCQTACSFIKHKPKASNLQGEWRFQEDIHSQVDPLEIRIDWKPPTAVPGSTDLTSPKDIKTGPIVYVLATRNNNRKQDGWKVVTQLVSNTIRVEMDAVPLSPEFMLQAVSERGLMAQKEFKTDSIVLADIEDPSGPEFNKLHAAEESGWYEDHSKGVNATMTLVTSTVKGNSGSYRAQTADVKFQGPEWLSQDKEHIYSLSWFLIDCRDAYDFVPSCSLPRLNYATMLSSKGNEDISYTIPQLNFNSIYLLVIHLHEDYRVKAEVVFKTEPCLQPDSLQLTQCLDDIEEASLPSVPIKLVDGPAFEPEVLRLAVNISSMTREAHTDRVLVNVTWSPVVNQSVAYNVTTFSEGTGVVLARRVTSHPFIVLTLQQDTQYLVKVEANLKPQSGETIDSAKIEDTLQFNTSDVNLAIYQGPQAFRLKNDDEMDQVDGIIIGVTCFIIIFVLVALITILYKKRKSFKDIIVTKATVAKSNSYKSNVGGKSDYSNQLIVFSDEWELDPLMLKFSTLLGQGAFGKVVTGYYEDQKVAIKLVREGAPMSYKEDLVAEINLMKRIGSHPNIVCLIGACTMSEPIALVMEYVPYGNLQNFLKKCRLEGDLLKRTDGPTEITYTVMQESGGIESGVVSPTDMLSFARQVSMAMEYLAEKKYVHRDLAARNVLIDYNKVVKVCDFGLSRDIFNDNHYKKLTNGKLPLKWMAIESLRDRIFTTQSDVWSFGILLWEIVTMGASPYPNVALADLYYVLSNGYRMDRPSNCSQELYTIMRSCWEDEPVERPDFTQLRLMLEDLLTEDRDYLVLEDIDVPLTNSDNSSSPSPPASLDNGQTSAEPAGATAGPRSYPTTPATSSTNPSHPTKVAKKASPRRDNMRINVCIHQKSTDRLIRPSESDSSPSSC